VAENYQQALKTENEMRNILSEKIKGVNLKLPGIDPLDN